MSDSQYFRPTEVEQLLGDPSKAKNKKLLYKIRRRKEPNGISNIFYSFKSINKNIMTKVLKAMSWNLYIIVWIYSSSKTSIILKPKS